MIRLDNDTLGIASADKSGLRRLPTYPRQTAGASGISTRSGAGEARQSRMGRSRLTVPAIYVWLYPSETLADGLERVMSDIVFELDRVAYRQRRTLDRLFSPLQAVLDGAGVFANVSIVAAVSVAAFGDEPVPTVVWVLGTSALIGLIGWVRRFFL